ncbi:ABC transporter permease subunit [Fodinibius salinus]|uniref:ABC transporter permease subunit n=1 Tax=Fodinibius salinus TaxID=860790 RepID=UPI0011E6A749|nr:ABC transporter permease subunit [Fodinibius salinus]
MRIFEQKLFKNKVEATGLLLFLLLAVLPLLLGIIYALLYSLGITGLVSDGFTLKYWQQAFTDIELWYSMGYTFYIALATITLTIAGALLLTIYLKEPLQQGFAGFSIYVPLAFPAIVVAFLIFQLASQSGFFARIIYQLGWISSTAQFPELVNDTYGIGIIAAHTFMALPFFTLYFINLYDQENINQLAKVGQTLGASSAQQHRRIVVPILLRRAFPTLTLYTIFVMGSYEIPLIVGRQSPQMISVLVIRKLRKFNLSDIPEAYISALLFITLIIIGLTLIFKNRNFSYDLDQ